MSSYRVRFIVGPNRGRFPYSNCLLLESAMASILVDSGCGAQNLTAVKDGINAVIYTHYHPDHISGHHMLGRVRVYAPEGEMPYKSLEDLARRFASTHYKEWMEFAMSYVGVKTVPIADEYYKPGEDVCIRDVCIKTIPAPGHLKTHTILELSGSHIHLTDIDLTSFGPWYANPESDPLQFIADIDLALSLDARLYTTSHKEEEFSPDKAREALVRYSYRIFEVAWSIYNSIGPGEEVTGWNLAGRGVVYRRYAPGIERLMKYFEAMMIDKLLPILHAVGCIERRRKGYVKRGCSMSDLKILVRVG